MRTYVVKGGDTLANIAAALLGDADRWRELAKLNAIANANLIQIGQVLQIPDAPGAIVYPAIEAEPVFRTAVEPPLAEPVFRTAVEPPVIVGFDPAIQDEVLQEITVTGRRIDYWVLLGVGLTAWLLFGGLGGSRRRR